MDAIEEARRVAQELMSHGLLVTSNWHWWNVPEALKEDKTTLDKTIMSLDLGGLYTAQMVMVLTTKDSTKGGFHVEVGHALAMHKPVMCIGPRPNAFYYAPHVKQFDAFEDFCKWAWEGAEQMFTHPLDGHDPSFGPIDSLPSSKDILSSMGFFKPDEPRIDRDAE